ncbi:MULTISPECIES: sulfotransferase [unclassified Ruegeria]|uniref:tetratricopeptide repeat-containing sulfotransferase family protein n=1 Tax=unclassified Ruegeria TaxID=2625375 RepID=UPI001489BA40|nr:MULTISPECIES: sulfotransferase [unclassified Ruegeria]
MAQQTAKSLKTKAINDLEAGKLAQALKKAQLGVKKFPKDTDYLAIAGFVLTEMQQYRKSIPYFAEAAKRKPEDPQFAENLANALMQTGQIPRALSYAEQKLKVFPDNKELVRVTDEIQLKGKNWRLIIDHATKRLQAEPDNAEMLSNRGRAYGQIAFNEHATSDIARAYELAPDVEDIAIRRATNLHQSGDKEGAKEILDRIFARNPKNAAVLYPLAESAPEDEFPVLRTAIENAIAQSEQQDSVLEFAKAILLRRSEGLDASMPQFAKANTAQHESNPYDPNLEEQTFETLCRLFPVDAPAPSSDVIQSPQPIFVIGQPRSGTTLMEMMLSSAPGIAGCGELMISGDLSAEPYQKGVPFTSEDATVFAGEYRKLLPPIPEDTIAFVDKMPHNYQQVGFLLAAFPNARVINMLRDPRDVGLSKWIRRFPAPGMRYASNLEAIAHSANLYRKYMAHWQKGFGDRILTVPYEDLVSDPETLSRKVTDFCGIPWHEKMVQPEKNTKLVKTASIDQVRNKISTKSIGGWRAVEDHIRPMLEGFDPALWPEYDLS